MSGDNDWYNYRGTRNGVDHRTSRWANAEDVNGNMFVWIPRYAYRIAYFDTVENANKRRANPNHTDRISRI